MSKMFRLNRFNHKWIQALNRSKSILIRNKSFSSKNYHTIENNSVKNCLKPPRIVSSSSSLLLKSCSYQTASNNPVQNIPINGYGAPEPQYKVGDRLHGYHVDAVQTIPELCLTAYRLTFEKNGAEHLHIAREDPNNLFGVIFRTTPEDSTGVAHILEHLALCGSHRYPVRDPFMKMLTRSLSTFMNAFTGCDYTMYPFSTQNPKDFYNLMSIYLDAVFHPRLRYLDFLQEGWRLEHSDPNDPNSPLVFKGVVFNEMKGAFSSASTVYIRQMISKLFPENTYRNESGGDPLCIPELSYEQLKQFHNRHYHPSNARFFTYGNFPLENHLKFIGKVIDKFDADESLRKMSYIPEQHSWTQHQKIKLRCPNDPLAPFPDRQTTASMAWVLKSLSDVHENFTLSILCTLLMHGPNSPFYQALIDSGLGSDYSPHSGYHNFTKQSIFSIGLQGISADQTGAVYKAINMALMDSYTEGFPQQRIDAILHRIELDTKHQGSNFGLALLMYINSTWNHDIDPLECLNINAQVEKFKENLRNDPKYLQKKVKQYFLDNNHRLMIEMSPDPEYEAEQQRSEQVLLNEKIAKLDPDDLKEIFKNGQELLQVQNALEDVSVLPTLTVKDISRTIAKTNIELIKMGTVPVQYSAQPTNGIVYFNAVLPLKPELFPKKLVPYLPLFAQVLTKLGAGKYDRKQLDQEIQMHTGGLNSMVHIADHFSAFDRFESGLYLNSYCLERNLDQMFHLWTEVFSRIRFHDDPDHLIQMIRICSAELAQSVSHQGHAYAMRRAASFFGGAFKLRELTSGMTSLAYFRLMAASSGKVSQIIEHLEQIARIALTPEKLRCAVNAEAPTMRQSLQVLEKFLQSIGSSAKTEKIDESDIGIGMPTLQPSLPNEHFVFPFATNFLGRSVYCAPFSHPDHAKLRIAASLVTMKFLHKEIREKGGAYGGGARLDSGGAFHCYSYRDPQITKTMKTFEKTGEWMLRADNYRDEDIDEAKLQVFQSVDQPIPPGDQGLEQFLTGITDDMKQEYRIRLLDVNKADIQEVAARYLVPFQSGCTVVLGPKNEETKSGNWKIRIASGDGNDGD